MSLKRIVKCRVRGMPLLPVTFILASHQVIALPRNWTEHVVHVQVEGGGEVKATRSHPSFVEGRGWTNASDLQVGDRLRDEWDHIIKIERLWTEDKTADTFNLTVEGVHTYYVLAGGTPVLVHNVIVDSAPNFHAARRQAFERAGMTDPSAVQLDKPHATRTYTEFIGPDGAKVAYDGPHADMDVATGHDNRTLATDLFANLAN